MLNEQSGNLLFDCVHVFLETVTATSPIRGTCLYFVMYGCRGNRIRPEVLERVECVCTCALECPYVLVGALSINACVTLVISHCYLYLSEVC